jgi:hypothetical protein
MSAQHESPADLARSIFHGADTTEVLGGTRAR